MKISDVPQPSLSYEDLEEGFKWTTPSRTITESEIHSFAGLSGDYNQIHVDDLYAGKSVFKSKVAHGLLVLSILSGLLTRTMQNQLMSKNLIGLLNVECSFPKPTFAGDTIYGEIEIASKRITSKGDKGIVTFKRRALNQRNEVVVDSTFTMMIALGHLS